MDDKLLRRYIMEKASRKERREVVSWVNESQDNLERFATMKAEHVFSGFPDTIVPEKRPIRPILVHMAAALSIPLLAGAIWLLLSRNEAREQYADASRQVEILKSQNPGDVTYIANPGTKSLVILPDSSVVRLNGASKLVVPSRFAAGSRELFLSGEGYFDIRHHEDWPMNIHTSKGVVVKVLGTTFDLSAYDNDDNIKLTLIEGKVVVREEKTGSEHEVRPNQQISIASRTGELDKPLPRPVIKRANIQQNTGWVNGELIFNNTAMPEIVKQLERWYGVHVHIVDKEILDYHLTATFTTESITRVLDLIKFSSMLQYEINGTDVYIRKI
jgi:ferric-dicitrate binding protein FerR (iron transport regulator)